MMNCYYVRNRYGVPACLGRRVSAYGEPGIITEDRGYYIGILLATEISTSVYALVSVLFWTVYSYTLSGQQPVTQSSRHLAYRCETGFPVRPQSLVEACSCQSSFLGHLCHPFCSGGSIQGMDKLFISPFFCGSLQEETNIFIGFKVVGYIKRRCFQCHCLFLQLFYQIFCFHYILFLAGFIAASQQKNNTAISDSVIDSDSTTKKEAQLKEFRGKLFMIAKVAGTQRIKTKENSGPALFVPNFLQPFIKTIRRFKLVSHGSTVSNWIQIVNKNKLAAKAANGKTKPTR